MNKKFISSLYILFVFAAQTLFASSYEMKIDDCEKISESQFEFSVYLNGLEDDFVVTSYQGVFAFNQDVLNSDSLYFEFVPESSEMPSLAPNKVHIDTVGVNIRLMFASGIANDSIGTERKRIGKFIVKSKSNFREGALNLEWLFDGDKLTLVLGKNFSVITDPRGHINQVVGVEEENVVADYELMQNYPNPFNPTTNIKFKLKEAGFVRLTVFNSIGEEINEYFNSELSRGTHEVKINGSNWASGIYYYRLEVKNKFSEVKKMVLVK